MAPVGRALDASGAAVDVVWASGGKIGLGHAPTTRGDEFDAWVSWVMSDPAKFSLAQLSNEQLEELRRRLQQLLSDAPLSARGPLLHALLQVGLRAKGVVAARATDTYEAVVKREPVEALRTMAARAFVASGAPVRPALSALAHPSSPPYQEWLRDGVISVELVIDGQGTPWADAMVLLLRVCQTKHENADGSVTFTRPGSPPMRFHLRKPSEEQALFDKMNDPGTDIIVYSGHSGYGHRVRHALASGVSGSGKGKLVVLMQCYGLGNLNDLAHAYPEAQLVATTGTSTNTVDSLFFQSLIAGLASREAWPQIRNRVVARLSRDHADEGFDPAQHYVFPCNQALVRAISDLDRDGVFDDRDPVFSSVTVPSDEPSAGLQPVAQAVPAWSLRGGDGKDAVEQLNTIFGYDHFFGPQRAASLPWRRDALHMAGFFEPSQGDDDAFRFVRNGDSVEVRLSTRYAHASQPMLARLLAVEWSRYAASLLRLDEVERSALTLLLLQRLAHMSHSVTTPLLAARGVVEPLIARRYGWPVPTSELVDEVIGDVEDILPSHYQAVVSACRTSGLNLPHTIQTTQLMRALAVPVDAPSFPDVPGQQVALCERLGLPGRWVSSETGGGRLSVIMEEASSVLRQYELVFDGNDRLAAVGRLDPDLSIHEHQLLSELRQAGAQAGVSLGDLWPDYAATMAARGRDVAMAELQVKLSRAHFFLAYASYSTRKALERLWGEARYLQFSNALS